MLNGLSKLFNVINHRNTPKVMVFNEQYFNSKLTKKVDKAKKKRKKMLADLSKKRNRSK